MRAPARLTYAVQTELFPEPGRITLCCPACSGIRLLPEDWAAEREGETLPCGSCLHQPFIPNLEVCR